MSFLQNGPACTVPTCQRPAYPRSEFCDFHRPKKPASVVLPVNLALLVEGRRRAEAVIRDGR